ncbi:TonB-dependent receptor [Sphingomonas sp. UV9]|uniref:TonB-dependent receptor domain-containing protein n=1 Tax=Sphingomonas sp. UV9 TaxID=1851410 RepID=UPI0013E8B552|nr:TonB-dependent receptor [Sphingomonas sp. UV9]
MTMLCRLASGASLIAATLGYLSSTSAMAQSATSFDPQVAQELRPDEQGAGEIIVTGSRIERNGFDQPTPTTVIGATELREGARTNVQQVLNDLPQFRPTVVPQNSNGNVSNSGAAPADLRGLGPLRTLTLLNGRRFIGDNNLNVVPFNLVSRIDVVTGGASAAYGSGAVAGVVNIVLNDKLDGLSLGGQSSISSRGDGRRYGFDGTFGTSFADGRGHFIAGVEYVDDQGIGPDGRTSRPFLGAGIVRINPAPGALDQRTQIVPNVNFGNTAIPGLITSGVLAGQVFNSDGTLRPFRGGTQILANPAARFQGQMIGGEDGTSQTDNVYLSTPFERITSYARASFDVGNATIWADGSYGRVKSNYPFLYDPTIPPINVSVNNGFLPGAVRNQLLAAGQSNFTLGRYFVDAYTIGLQSKRQTYEGAIGIDGSVGAFKYRAHYSHGETIRDEALQNMRLASQYANALNSVLIGGTPVCAINADASTANDDAACAPINPFGYSNLSAAAKAYTTGTQFRHSRNQLDAAAVQVQGDLFILPAGPATAVIGGEYRKERQDQSVSSTPQLNQFAVPVFGFGLNGGFNVKEAFGEIALPIIDASDLLKVDLNGAGRYSDYSNTGGIWSWKAGATVRLFNDLLIRGVRSRDIRSPSIDPELFTPQSINILNLSQDFQAAQYAGTPGYNPNPSITTFTGGNPQLRPEVAKTFTVGGTYSPSFAKGLALSIDYYDIKLADAIGTLNASQLTQACSLGNSAACGSVVRDATGTVTTAFINFRNLASLLVRGYDIEASYVVPLSQLGSSLPGTLRIRGLANYTLRNITNNGLVSVDSAPNAVRWRGRISISYQNDNFGIDTRVRYLSGGPIDTQRDVVTNPTTGVTSGVINNRLGSYAYFDLGVQFRVADRFTLFGNVNNLFNRTAPLETLQSGTYDQIGTYFTAGARVKF